MTKEKKNNTREKVVLSILVIILIGSIAGLFYIGFKSFDSVKNNKNGNKPNIIVGLIESFKNFGPLPEKDNLEFFNNGTNSGYVVIDVVDKVLSRNDKGEDLTIIFNDKKYKKDDIESIKKLVDTNNSYNFKYKYNNAGLETIIIKREITEQDKDRHNGTLEFMYKGTKSGFQLKSCFDEIININEKGERIITIDFLGTQYTDVKEMRKLKQCLDDFTDYEIYYEYDNDGFINKAIIERVN